MLKISRKSTLEYEDARTGNKTLHYLSRCRQSIMLNIYTLSICIAVLFQYPNLSLQSTTENGTFCYDDPTCGPKSAEWPGICQTGLRQSPINLPHTIATIFESRLKPRALNFQGYIGSSFFIRNNEHSIQLSFTSNLSSSSEMSGYGFEAKYGFAQAHFHWGKNIVHGGSEHTINNRHFPMELHLIHYNKDKYSNFSVAAATTDDPQALAVLALFLEPRYTLFRQSSSAFSTIANNLPDTFQASATQVNETLNLAYFLPKHGDMVYRYSGSLTTPGCTQSVKWTVIPKPVPVQASDYWKFHSVQDEEGHALEGNYRPIQSLNGRSIELFHKHLVDSVSISIRIRDPLNE